MAVKVFPDPVAIWIRARGRSSAKDFSRFSTALTWAGQSPAPLRGGIVLRWPRRVPGRGTPIGYFPPGVGSGSASSQVARTSGRWKWKRCRLRGSGSRWFAKRVSTPVER
jgi:hypothetical protein